MTDVPTFSVIIPTYNYGRYLPRAVESVLEQAGPSREVIVVDDGSTDDTPQVAARYGGRIVYHRQANAGVAAARNAGLELARGTCVLFLDADDRLLPGALAEIAAAFAAHPAAGMVFGGYRTVGERGVRQAPPPPVLGAPLDNFRGYLERRFTMGNGHTAIRRAALGAIRFPVGVTHGEDVVVFGQVLANHPCIALATPLAEIFDHPQRARRNAERLLANGLKTVDALFDAARLPAAALRLRPLFEARWLLELGRAAAQVGDRRRARACYRRALALDWGTALRWKHVGRYLRTYWPQRKAA